MKSIMGLFGGGGSGSGVPNNFQIPPFHSAGGITPEQQGLVDFTGHEDLMGIANEFGSSGTGESTMATQGAEGAHTAKAQEAGQISDVNTAAEYVAYQNQVNDFLQNLNNQQSLDTLAQQNQQGNDFLQGFQSTGAFDTGTTT